MWSPWDACSVHRPTAQSSNARPREGPAVFAPLMKMMMCDGIRTEAIHRKAIN